MSDEYPMAKNTSRLWWIAIALGGLSAAAGFFVAVKNGFDFDFPGGLVAIALNPLVWLAFFAFTRINRFVCPHCGKLWQRDGEFEKIAVGGLCKCHCSNVFRKPPVP